MWGRQLAPAALAGASKELRPRYAFFLMANQVCGPPSDLQSGIRQSSHVGRQSIFKVKTIAMSLSPAEPSTIETIVIQMYHIRLYKRLHVYQSGRELAIQ